MNAYVFKIGNFGVRWYSLLILIGVIVGILLIEKEGKKFNISKDFLFNMAFWTVIIGIIGARVYYVIFNFNLYKNDLMSIFKIWEGGLAIYGAVIAAILVILYECKKFDKPFIETLDILAPSLMLGQAIGRWGNFFNMEAYGPKTSLTFLHSLHLPQFIIDGMYIDGSYYQPMFLYESIWCLIGFTILMLIRKRSKKDGTQVSFYFLWYGLGRIVIESFRTDSLYFFCFKVSQIVSLILITIGLVGLILNKVNINKTISGEVRNNNDRI